MSHKSRRSSRHELGSLVVLGIAMCLIGVAAGSVYYLDRPGSGADNPWADAIEIGGSVAPQGLMLNGGPVSSTRSSPFAVLGPAEKDTVDAHVYSLGFGGKVILYFENEVTNGPGDDIELVESSLAASPDERVDVYVSVEGWNNPQFFLLAKDVNKTAKLALPGDVPRIKLIMLVDVSNPANFGAAANEDGYDLDGVRALHGTTGPAPAPQGATATVAATP